MLSNILRSSFLAKQRLSHPTLQVLYSRFLQRRTTLFLWRILDVGEITAAVKSIGATKALGPDGFTGLFYQLYWSLVGCEVIHMVQQFFTNGYMLRQLNHSFIALILKHDSPTKIMQYRPISLYNVSYKIISKIMAARLTGV